MSTSFDVRYAHHPSHYKEMDTATLREHFLIKKVLLPGEINLTYTHYDRFIAGGAVPLESALKLESIDPLKSEHFLDRRELGIINVGAKGGVQVDGESFELENREALYVGQGAKDIQFSSDSGSDPAKFYLNSAPAHKSFPTKKISREDTVTVDLGDISTSNARTIRKFIVNDVIDVCQLQMGMTELKPGCVWNTMPPHSHDRRMEVYLYFEVAEDQSVCHFMGPHQETRHIWVNNEQAVISPPWSIHAGSGTSSYTFIWGMAGENLDYGDMDKHAPTDLR